MGVHGGFGYGTVDDPAFARQVNLGAGEDICPGEKMPRALFACGDLTTATTAATGLRVLAQTEISPTAIINVCGTRFETGIGTCHHLG